MKFEQRIICTTFKAFILKLTKAVCLSIINKTLHKKVFIMKLIYNESS